MEKKKEKKSMSFLVATTSLPAVDGPNADRWNAACSRQKFQRCFKFCCQAQPSSIQLKLSLGLILALFSASTPTHPPNCRKSSENNLDTYEAEIWHAVSTHSWSWIELGWAWQQNKGEKYHSTRISGPYGPLKLLAAAESLLPSLTKMYALLTFISS